MPTESTGAPRRIVSLLASATEIVCALGLGDELVGRSHECDNPEWVKRLPCVSRPLFDVTGSSADIDARVRARLHAGQPLYGVDDALLVELAPNFVVTQTHCEVCAVSPADLAHGTPARLVKNEVIALGAGLGTLDGIFDGVMTLAAALGRADRGRDLVSECRARLQALAERTRALDHPSVVCLEWVDPPFAMGNWGPELVELAGGRCLLGTPGAHSTTTPWDNVLQADPDVLVIAPCGYDLDRALAERPLLENKPRWNDLRAVESARVFFADGNRFFNRSGTSVVDSAEMLAEMLHSDALVGGATRAAWRRIDDDALG